MRAALALALFALAALVVAMAEGKTHHEGETKVIHKCRRPIDLFCKYTKKCTKIATKCTKYKKMKHCKKWKKVKKTIKKPYCKKYKHVKNKCGAKKVCVKAGFKRVRATIAKCKKFVKKKYCVRRKQHCIARKLLKRCHIRTPRIIVTGPKKCKPGYKLIFKRHGNHIRRKCVKEDGTPKPIEYKTCSIYNDPHFQSFLGTTFDVHKEGDFQLVETKDKMFTVHGRFKRMDPKYAWTGIIGAAISPNGVDVVKIYPGNKIVLNNKDYAAVDGANSALPNGGTLLKKGNNVEVFGLNGAKALITNHGTLINIVVYVDKTVKTSGLCDGVKVGTNDMPISGLFTHRLHSKVISKAIHLRHFKDHKAEKNAALRCKAEKLTGKALKACIFDMMQIKNPTLRKQMLKIEHDLKKEVKWGKAHHTIKIVKRAHHHRHHKRHRK